MKTGRPVLRFFSEADLLPAATPQATEVDNADTISGEDLASLERFSTEFGREGEVLIPLDDLSRHVALGMFIRFCVVLGAAVVRTTNGIVRVRTSGRLGRHLPEILTIYLKNSFRIIETWDSVHIVPEDSVSALELVHQMELRRIEQERLSGHAPRPLAERPVAFAVFHAKNKKGESCFLFEINKDWRRLNFIGGKQEPHDNGNHLATARREISEELGIARHRVSLTQLNDQPLIGYSLSGNAGSLARYPCVLYGVRVDGDLKVRMQDRWLTEAIIRRCLDLDDSPLMVNPTYLTYLLGGTPSRLSRVPLSTTAEVRSTSFSDLVPNGESTPTRWARVTRENKDLAAAVLTLIAAIVTLILTI